MALDLAISDPNGAIAILLYFNQIEALHDLLPNPD